MTESVPLGYTLFSVLAGPRPRTAPDQAALAELETVAAKLAGDGVTRRVEGLTLLDYPMSRGAVAGYYPELNPLIALSHHDRASKTPASKAVPVRIATGG